MKTYTKIAALFALTLVTSAFAETPATQPSAEAKPDQGQVKVAEVAQVEPATWRDWLIPQIETVQSASYTTPSHNERVVSTEVRTDNAAE